MLGAIVGDQLQGTVFVVASAFVFATVALIVQTDSLPILIATELRFLVSWLVAIVFMLMFKRERGLRWFGPPELRLWLGLKCLLHFSFVTLWWSALRFAALGDCIAIIYSSAIFTAILSRIVMKEPLPSWFLTRVLLNCVGAVLVLDPPFVRKFFVRDVPATQSSYTFVFLALIAASALPVVTAKIKDCSWIEVEHVSACLSSTIFDPALVLASFVFTDNAPKMPLQTPVQVALILLAAVGSFLGLALETKGYQLADVGAASMFRILEIPFGYVLQTFTGTSVTVQAVLGSLFIVASCFLGISRICQDPIVDVDQEELDEKPAITPREELQ